MRMNDPGILLISGQPTPVLLWIKTNMHCTWDVPYFSLAINDPILLPPYLPFHSSLVCLHIHWRNNLHSQCHISLLRRPYIWNFSSKRNKQKRLNVMHSNMVWCGAVCVCVCVCVCVSNSKKIKENWSLVFWEI
jgi:hypothetical protein